MSQCRTLCGLLCAALVGAAAAAPAFPWGASWPAQPPVPGESPDRETAPLPRWTDEDDEPETEIVLTDGRRVSGVLIGQNDREVILRISGIPTPFAADTVANVKTGPTVLERYHEMRRIIDDRDVQQRLRLAEWLRARRKYQLAFDEVAELLKLEPANREVRDLHVWLTEQLKLIPRERPGLPAPPLRGAPEPDPAPAAFQPLTPVFPLLTPEQINLIRIYEVDLNDPPRLLVDRDTITAILTQYSNDPAIPNTREGRDALYRKRPGQILELLFQLKARELYGRVQVQEDPVSMRLFRDHVHSTWLLNSCATNQCHGGQEAGRLRLYNKKPSSDATAYTNFLILERYQLTPRPGDQQAAPGTAGRLVDYDDPARSPLVQMGLPRKDSQYPHPQVNVAGRQRGFSPVFQSPDDRRFQDTTRWIRSMYRPRPDYPVQYDPPGPTPLPATPSDGKRPTGER